MANRQLIVGVGAGIVLALTGCGSGDAKTFDIAPIFPASSDKCARYGGEERGSGLQSSCMVTKSECEKAAADWRNAMSSSGVNDAIEFSCH